MSSADRGANIHATFPSTGWIVFDSSTFHRLVSHSVPRSTAAAFLSYQPVHEFRLPALCFFSVRDLAPAIVLPSSSAQKSQLSFY